MHAADLRRRKLEEACKGYQLLREAGELGDWIKAKEQVAVCADIGTDLEQVEVLQKKFDDFQSDLRANEVRLAEMNQIAHALTQMGQTEAAVKIKHQIDVSSVAWNFLILVRINFSNG